MQTSIDKIEGTILLEKQIASIKPSFNIIQHKTRKKHEGIKIQNEVIKSAISPNKESI